MGIKTLRRLQMGAESTAGTAVDATSIWRGTGVLVDRRELVYPEEDSGIVGGVGRSYIPYHESGIKLDATPVTFEQLPYLLEMGCMTATPSDDGAGSGKIRVYNFPTSAAGGTLKTYTFEAGDDQQEEEVEYCFCTDFTISGSPREACMMEANLVGRQTTKSTFTGSLTAPTVYEALYGKTALKYDAIDGTMGSTAKAATMLGFKLNVKTGWNPFYGDGNDYFAAPVFTGQEISCDLALRYNDIGEAIEDAMIAQTPLLWRIAITGAALTTPGTTYTYRTIYIDFAGKVRAKPQLEDEDGLDIINVTIDAHYYSAAASWLKMCEITVVNDLAALP